MMYFADRCDHAIPFVIDANALPIAFLYYESVSNLMHDVNKNKAPLNTIHLFEKTSSIHSYYTRSSVCGTSHSFCCFSNKLLLLFVVVINCVLAFQFAAIQK